MFRSSLRCFMGLAVAVACLSPAMAQQQQRTPDALTRFLDSILKPEQGQGAPTQPSQAAPSAEAAEPSEAAPAQAPTKPKIRAAAPKPKAPANPQTQAPQPAPQTVAKPIPKQAPAQPEAKQAAPEPSKPAHGAAPPAEAAEKPQAPEPVPAKMAEPPKPAPARSTPAQAATPVPVSVAAPATPVSPPNPVSPAAALERVNGYFNAMDQMSAYFVQKNPNGQQVEGTLSVRRPGQLHFAYAPPSTLEIVSDGRNVAIRDKQLGTNDVYPVGQTPLKFLVQENVDLARDTKLRDVQIGRDGMITVSFDDSATLGGTSKITLKFDGRANALRQWTVVDSQGYETSVTLSGLNVVQRKNASAAN